jgi:GNAT superfamily N-acetyltransferase
MIRPANINDAKNIIELNIKEWKNTYKGIFPSEYLDNLDNLKEETILKCQDKIHEYVVFEENNKILGFIKYGNNRQNYLNEYGEIHALYVLSESQKNGIGKQLINYVLENNKGKYKYFLVATLAKNSANVFYKKCGFKKVGNVYFELNGKIYKENLYCIKMAHS